MTIEKHSNNLSDLADWVDAQDVMQKLHISIRTLQTLRTNGTLPFSRIGGKLYYRISDILKVLKKNYT
jgi:DNA-binding transcriptional MerR regulator